MGHGTEHYANATYSELEHMMHDEGYENAFVGTVEGFPTIDNAITEVTAYGATKVVLYPFMVVAGDHANNDMAGDEADSWKTAFMNAGFEVECRIEGLSVRTKRFSSAILLTFRKRSTAGAM
jgi:sirohydrochlorin cobaltochelatase